MTPAPSVPALLDTAVTAVRGTRREGQVKMAQAVEEALDSRTHLAVQAGTGTGKSLAYLVPALRHAVTTDGRVIVSTATRVLQRQLITRDVPRTIDALADDLGRRPTAEILLGRNNYLCLNKCEAPPEDPTRGAGLLSEEELTDTGRDVLRLREWAAETESGERHDVPFSVSEQSWRHVSVTSRECLGATHCPFGEQCFAELARARAAEADVVVTNHSLLAIDLMTDMALLPAHDAVIVDEAHELSRYVTTMATGVLSASAVTAAAKAAAVFLEDGFTEGLAECATALEAALGAVPDGDVGRWTSLSPAVATPLTTLARQTTTVREAIGSGPAGETANDPQKAAARTEVRTQLADLAEAAERMLSSFAEPDPAARFDVVWHSRSEREGNAVHVAPLTVSGLLRTALFEDATVVLTSATLKTGGSFDGVAAAWGLPPSGSDRAVAQAAAAFSAVDARDGFAAEETRTPGGTDSSHLRWTGLDVGSPFDYPRRGILYVPTHLPEPRLQATAPEVLEEMQQLITAAGGRTLGLFTSSRGARVAAEAMRSRCDVPVLLQGEDSIPALVERFAQEPETCLFGTLSLWQGVDVPGPSLSLVLIDRLPFPRPDDPLTSAQIDAVKARGGNGFMAISANHAALLLAQGAGRLLRTVDDRGVVAVLDPRLMTKRYGGYLRASLPDFWGKNRRDLTTTQMVTSLRGLRDA